MNKYPELDYRPFEVDLSNKEKVDLQMQSFYLNHPLHEAQALLWKLYRGWLQHEATVGSDAEALDHMMVFQEDMERLLGAVYVQLKMGEEQGTSIPVDFLAVPGGIPNGLLPALELLVNVVDPEKIFLRTKPYGYSIFNLDAMTILCQIVSTESNNLFNYVTSDGKSIIKGIEFLYPFIADKSKWTLKPDVMYWSNWPVAQPFLIFGADAYENQNWFGTNTNQKWLKLFVTYRLNIRCCTCSITWYFTTECTKKKHGESK